MVVSFTPNIALAMPSEGEVASNWVNGTQLQEDNNAIIEDKTDVNLLPFGGTLKGHSADPSIGAGGIRYDYQEFQGLVWGSFVVLFADPGVATGTGEYGIKLPFVVDNAFHTVGAALNELPAFNSNVGGGYIYDASNQNASGPCALDVVTVGGISYARLVTEAYAGKTNGLMGSTGPFSVANGDRFTGSFIYKKL